MKCIVLIYLLSVSITLSQSTPQAADVHPAEAPTKPAEAAIGDKLTPTEPAKNETQTPKPTEATVQNATNVQNETATNQTQTVKNESSPNALPANTEKANQTVPANKSAEATPTIKPEPPKDDKNTTKHDEKAEEVTPIQVKNETTTVKPAATTVKPKNVPPTQARAFDGPSFFGGIILTLGLLAIGFMGYKYYKNRTDGNYYPV